MWLQAGEFLRSVQPISTLILQNKGIFSALKIDICLQRLGTSCDPGSLFCWCCGGGQREASTSVHALPWQWEVQSCPEAGWSLLRYDQASVPSGSRRVLHLLCSPSMVSVETCCCCPFSSPPVLFPSALPLSLAASSSASSHSDFWNGMKGLLSV